MFLLISLALAQPPTTCAVASDLLSRIEVAVSLSQRLARSHGATPVVIDQRADPMLDDDHPITTVIIPSDAGSVTFTITHFEAQPVASQGGAIDLVEVKEVVTISLSGTVQGANTCEVLWSQTERLLDLAVTKASTL